MDSVYEKLCYKDDRHPDFVLDDDFVQTPRDNCWCDNCFYGLDELALHIIYLEERIEALETADIFID